MNIIINGPHEITNFAKKLAHTYDLYFVDLISACEEFLNTLVNYIFKVFFKNYSFNRIMV